MLKNYLQMGSASEVEVQTCLEVARRYKLDPYKKGQIWFIRRWDSNAANNEGGKGAYVWTPQVGIYGFLHIAARDHDDYGSISEPEYGPMFMHDVEGKKFKAPEWCRVKAFKKGVTEPTVATIYFDEFCPQKWENAKSFWAKMPRNQIAKCAKAQAVRFAWPDLAGLYIPEEMERMADDYTPNGRRIVNSKDVVQYGSHEAAQAVLAKKLADHAQNTQESVPGAAWKAEKDAKADAPPIDVKSSGKPPLPATASYNGVVEIDWRDEASPIIRGDIGQILDALKKYAPTMTWGSDSWWHCQPRDIEAIKQLCEHLGFKIVEIIPKQPPTQKKQSEQKKPKEDKPAVPMETVAGTIERTNSGMAGKNPVLQVTLAMAGKRKLFLSCFHKSIWDDIQKGLGQVGKFVISHRGNFSNIEKRLQIGSRRWEEDGTLILEKDREPGTPKLFK